MILTSAITIGGVIASAAATAVMLGGLGSRARAFGAAAAGGTSLIVAVTEPRHALALGALLVATAVHFRGERAPLPATAAAVIALAVAAWASPLLALAGLAALSWLIERRVEWVIWGAIAGIMAALPAEREAATPATRALLFLVVGGLALGTRRAVFVATAGPAVRRATFGAIAALPALAMLVLALLQGRGVDLPPHSVLTAVAVAVVALAAAALVAVFMVGWILVATTRNDLKVLLLGWTSAALVGLPLIGPAPLFLLAPVIAIGAAVGCSFLARQLQRRVLGRVLSKASPAPPDQK